MEMKRMNEMKIGERGVVHSVDATGILRRHFSELGISKGTEVQCVAIAPFGDPMSYRVGETVFAFRCCDTEKIQIRLIHR